MDTSNLSEVGIRAELKTSSGATTCLAELTFLVGPDSRFVRTQIDNVLDALRWRLEAALPVLCRGVQPADPINLQGSGPAPIVPREG